MNFKRALSMVLAAAMCTALAACGEQANNQQSEESEGTSKNVVLTESWDFSSSFYPVVTESSANNYGSNYWNRNFYNTLMCYDDQGNIQGELADTYEVSEDGMTYSFHIREGVKFSDGTPLTSESVKQSISAATLNLGAYNGSYGKLTTLIEDMQTPDEDTFVMVLSSPYYGTLNDLTMCNPLAIVNPLVLEDGGENARENCMNVTMGTGAYMFDSFENDTYTFVRNPYYWNDAPEVDSFQVKVIKDNDAKILALRNGEIDAVIGSSRMNYDAYTELSENDIFGTSVNDENTMTRYLAMNLSTEPFNDVNVREAVAYAINQEELQTTVFSGVETAAETLFPKSKPYCDVEQTTYNTDIEKANDLMTKAGWIDSDGDGVREKDGKALEITFSYNQSLSTINDAALAIASQLSKIGFKVTPVGADMMVWYGDAMSGNYSLILWFTYGGVYDPTTVMTNMNPNVSADPIAVQVASYLNDTSMMEELDTTTDLDRVQEIYTSVLQTIADQCLFVPVTYTHEFAVWDAEDISAYDYYPDSSYVNIAGIHLK